MDPLRIKWREPFPIVDPIVVAEQGWIAGHSFPLRTKGPFGSELANKGGLVEKAGGMRRKRIFIEYDK